MNGLYDEWRVVQQWDSAGEGFEYRLRLLRVGARRLGRMTPFIMYGAMDGSSASYMPDLNGSTKDSLRTEFKTMVKAMLEAFDKTGSGRDSAAAYREERRSRCQQNETTQMTLEGHDG